MKRKAICEHPDPEEWVDTDTYLIVLYCPLCRTDILIHPEGKRPLGLAPRAQEESA